LLPVSGLPGSAPLLAWPRLPREPWLPLLFALRLPSSSSGRSDMGPHLPRLLELLALLALAFSDWRLAACALLAFFVPVLAAPRLPLLRVASLSDRPWFLVGDFMGIPSLGKQECLAEPGTLGRRGADYLLLLLEERLLPELELRLPERLLLPLALARSLWALLFWVLALPPLLAACARLDLPDDEEDLEEEEELRDAIACSFGRLMTAAVAACGLLLNLGRPKAEPVGSHRGSA
jgi:hypothetical protein